MATSFACKTSKHDQCIGKKLVDGIGPVQIEPCDCECHKK